VVLSLGSTAKSFTKANKNPKFAVRILTDNASTWNFEADYANGEIFIDRTPANYHGFDAVMNARELLIGFGVGDTLHYYLTPNMDAFMKEVSAAVGSGTADLGDITFLDRMAASGLCHEYQTGRYSPDGGAQANLRGKYWVVRGTVSCPDCDPSRGKTSTDISINQKGNRNIRSENECKNVLNILKEKAENQHLATDLHCLRVSDPNAN
jgi:hypothetical protein